MRNAWWAAAALGIAGVIAAAIALHHRERTEPARTTAAATPEVHDAPLPGALPPPGLRGVVHDQEGQPVEGALVHLMPAPVPLTPCEALLDECTCDDLLPYLTNLANTLRPRASTQTDAKGAFVLPVEAAPDERVVAMTDLAPVDGAARPGDHLLGESPVGGGEPIDVTVTTGGHVVLSGGAPLPGAVVLGLRGDRVTWSAGSDERGLVRVPPVDLLVVLADDHAPATVDGDTEFIKLARGVVLSGVVLDQGRPRAGVQIVVAQDDGQQACARAETDLDGRWRIGPLRSTLHYRVTAETDGRRASVVQRANDDATELDAGLELDEPVVITGMVKETKRGRPLSGARVTAESMHSDARGGLHTFDRAETTTDAEGRFELSISAGEVELEATLDGFDAEPWTRTTTRHLSAGAHEDGWVLVLAQRDGVTGVVVDPSGAPLEDAYVSCLSSGRAAGAHTDERGHFQVACEEGPVELRAEKEGFLTATRSASSPGAGVVLTLARGVSVRGRVLDASNEPAPSVPVQLVRQDDEPGGFEYIVTERDGTFSADGLSDGHWVATAEDQLSEQNAGPRMRRRVSGFARLPFDVNGGNAPFLELRLQAPHTLTGRAVDEHGAPVAGVALFTEPGARAPVSDTARASTFTFALSAALDRVQTNTPEATSAADGTFTLDGLGVGPWTIRARAPGMRDDPRAPTVVEGGETNVTVRLAREPEVFGVVLDTDGVPVKDFSVAGHQVSSSDGTFAVQLGGAGDTTVHVVADGYVEAERPAALRWGQRVDLGEVRLARGRVVTVRCLDAVTGARLDHVFFNVGPVHLSWDRLTGTLSGVPLGDVRLVVFSPDHVATETALSATQQSLTVRLGRGATVRGTWTGQPGESLFAVLDLPSTPHRTEVRDGVFAFTSIPAGRFHLEIRGPADTPLGQAMVTVPSSGETTVTVSP